MLDRLSGMEVFTNAAKLGSISAAARKLDLSPSMATKHLDALEARLGVRLFQRSTRQLSLTEAGRQYVAALERLLPELEDVERTIASQRVEASGLLRMNVPLSFGLRQIAPLMHAFHVAHPNVTVELGLNDRVVDLIDEGWDLTIRIGHLKDSRLITRKLTDSTMVVCAAPAYWQRAGKPTQIAQLADHHCLGATMSSVAGPQTWLFGQARDRSVQIQGALRANNGDALLTAAIDGLGVLYEPDFIVGDSIESGVLEALTLDHESAQLGGIHLVYSKGQALPAKSRVMIDFLVKAFEDTQASRSNIA